MVVQSQGVITLDTEGTTQGMEVEIHNIKAVPHIMEVVAMETVHHITHGIPTTTGFINIFSSMQYFPFYFARSTKHFSNPF